MFCGYKYVLSLLGILICNAILSRNCGSKLFISLEDSRFSAERVEGANSITVHIGKVGVNTLAQIAAVDYLYESGRTNRQKSHSDWVGPYIISQKTGGNGKRQFTGGWHGSNGDGTGFPTARTVSFSAQGYVLDKGRYIAASPGKGSCVDAAEVTVVNLIQAGDSGNEAGTGKDALRETVIYTFIGDRIYVNVCFEALENIVIQRYYGLQICGYESEYRFRHSGGIVEAGRGEVRSVDCPVHSIEGTSSDGQRVTAALSENPRIEYKGSRRVPFSKEYHALTRKGKPVPLNSLEYVGGENYAFCADYGKAYYSLVWNKALEMSPGDKAFWSGYYVFQP